LLDSYRKEGDKLPEEKNTEEKKETEEVEIVYGDVPVSENYRRRPDSDNQAVIRVKLPNVKKNEIFAIADQLMGSGRIKVICEDGKSRMGRIPGKLKKRMWIREGDLVIVRPWEFQDEKADIVWRYTRIQAQNLARRNKIPESINIF